jgi:8-oxo-dGTP diphosphatase
MLTPVTPFPQCPGRSIRNNLRRVLSTCHVNAYRAGAGLHSAGGCALEPEHGDGPHAGVRVLAAVVSRDGRWLLCLRPRHKRHGGCWEFPGGKLEPGEDLLAAARRELHEELDVRVAAAGEATFVRRDPGSEFIIEFVDVEIEGDPRALEHEEVRWVEPHAALDLPLAPSDRAYVLYRLET